MSTINEAISGLGGEVAKYIKDELKDLLTDAKSDSVDLIKETGKKITEWLVMRNKGQLSDAEFESLLYARDRLLRQEKNTIEIEARARLEKIAVGLVNLVLDKILGAI